MEAGKVFERSVDSIQKIYAVVIALAVSQAIQNLLKGADGGTDLNLERISSGVPALVAFLFTVVPFWHGMNRHLDRCYLEKSANVVRGALLLDFATFLLEAIVLFGAAWSLRSGIDSFILLGLLLVLDLLWAFVSHKIHFSGEKSHAVKWLIINVLAVLVGILVVVLPIEQKPWVLMGVAILRSILDYWLCWEFYFP